MKKILFIATLILPMAGKAQCDVDMFEKIVWPKSPFSLLKAYAIPVHKIDGAPFSVQYSYVFTKGNRYAFYVKQPKGRNEVIGFTLTNAGYNAVTCDTMANFADDGIMLSYDAKTTGIYYMNLHSPRSFDGCVTLHLSYFPEAEKTKEGWTATLPPTRKALSALPRKLERDSLLRTFEFKKKSVSRYAIALEKDQLYALKVPDEQSAKNLSLHVCSDTDAAVKTYIIPEEKGYLFYIRSAADGTHIFDFANGSPDKSAEAYLMMAKERKLPK